MKMKALEHLVIVKKHGNGYSAYVPDIPGCIAAARTEKETLLLLKEALKIHVKDL
jgi:predicted RNase H-like HicB family nuclease